MNRDPSKILFLESIRGIAAFLVILGHFVVAFDYAPNSDAPHSFTDTNPVVRALGTAFFWPLTTGRLPVTTFFVLSGIALAQGFLRGGGRDYLLNIAVRRYFRLMIPSLVSVLFAFLLLKGGLMHNQDAAKLTAPEGVSTIWLEQSYTREWTLPEAIREGTWTIFFTEDSHHSEGRLNSVLWTMHPEFLGSFLVFGFLAIFGNVAQARTVALLIACGLVLIGMPMLALFPVGIALAITRQQSPHWEIPLVPASILVLAGLALGGLYDYNGTWNATVPGLGTKFNMLDTAPCLGATLLVIGLVFTPRFTRLLEADLFVWLGKISFGLYLCHVPIIMSVGCWTYTLMRTTGNLTHSSALLVVAAAVIPLSLLGGWVMFHIADRPAIAFGKWLANNLLQSSKKPTLPRTLPTLTPTTAS